MGLLEPGKCWRALWLPLAAADCLAHLQQFQGRSPGTCSEMLAGRKGCLDTCLHSDVSVSSEPRNGDKAPHSMSVARGQKDDGAESLGKRGFRSRAGVCSEQRLWAESASVISHKPALVWPDVLVWAHFDR